MFKIGDFSKISQVSVRTLRYYDEIGLLKPIQVDHFTGYRYYSFEQLRRLNRILALKDLGLSLEQVVQLLNEGVPANTIRGMLMLKQNELQQQLQEEQERLRRVQARLRQIEQEGKMPEYDVVLKRVEPMTVASVREVVGSLREVSSRLQVLVAEVGQWISSNGYRISGYSCETYLSLGEDGSTPVVEVYFPVEKALSID